ncbi:hypothetical protein KAR91_77110 [Candidatus Pacearchaeota archaeon]|nr:hypothetical protein [Candidatus Pacearchaeota archaeon]
MISIIITVCVSCFIVGGLFGVFLIADRKRSKPEIEKIPELPETLQANTRPLTENEKYLLALKNQIK